MLGSGDSFITESHPRILIAPAAVHGGENGAGTAPDRFLGHWGQLLDTQPANSQGHLNFSSHPRWPIVDRQSTLPKDRNPWECRSSDRAPNTPNQPGPHTVGHPTDRQTY